MSAAAPIASPLPESERGRAPLFDRASLPALVLLSAGSMSLPWLPYRFGGSNHSVQIPLLRYWMDPTLYARDLLPESLAGYATAYLPAMAALARVLGLELAFFVVYVLLHFVTLTGLFALAWEFFKDRRTALVACVLYFLNPLSLAGESCVASRFQHGHAATGMLVWALALHLRGRTLAGLALCGLAFNVHSLYAAYVAVLIGVDALLRWREHGWRGLVLAAASFVVLAAPTMFWIARAHEPLAPDALPMWLQIMRERSAPHVFPLAERPAVYAEYLLLLALGGLGVALAEARARRTCLHFLAAVLFLAVVGLVFTEWLPSALVIKAQLLRSTRWLTYIVLVFLARLVAVAARRGGLHAAAAASCVLGLLVHAPVFLGLALLLFLLAEPRRWPVPALLLGGAALLAAAASGALAPPEDGGVSELVSIIGRGLSSPRLVACLLLWLAIEASARARDRRWRTALLAIGGAVVALWVVPATYLDSRAATASQSWNELQAWVRLNTPRDALFLTPPTREGFRVFSERSAVGEWKDGTQQFFSAPFAFEWHRRMTRLGAPGRAYDDLDSPSLIALAREFGADYVVVAASRARLHQSLPKVFVNEVGIVYRVPPPEAAAPR